MSQSVRPVSSPPLLLLLILGLAVSSLMVPAAASGWGPTHPLRSNQFVSEEAPMTFIYDEDFAHFAPLYTNWSVKTYGSVPRYDAERKIVSYGCVELLKALPTVENVEKTDDEIFNLQRKFWTYRKTTLPALFKATYPWTLAKNYTTPGGLVTTYAVNTIGSVQIGINPSTPITASTLDQLDEIATYVSAEAKKAGIPDVPIVIYRDFRPRFGAERDLYDKYVDWNRVMETWVNENHNLLEPNNLNAVHLVQGYTTKSPEELHIECEVPLTESAKNAIRVHASQLANQNAITNPTVIFDPGHFMDLLFKFISNSEKKDTIFISRSVFDEICKRCIDGGDPSNKYNGMGIWIKYHVNETFAGSQAWVGIERELAINTLRKCKSDNQEALEQYLNSLLSRDSKFRPPLGGTLLTNKFGSAVTLGFPYAKGTTQGIITVGHIGESNDSIIGTEVFQPDYRAPLSFFNSIGTVTKASNGKNSDSAFIPYALKETQQQIFVNNLPNAQQLLISGYGGVKVGDWVYRSGDATHVISGRITETGVGAPDTVFYKKIVPNQIAARFESPSFPGDSGAPVYKLDENGNAFVIGIAWAQHGITTYISPFENIMTDLDLPFSWYNEPS